jgi:non-canonical purine NTP pyrophosphatase (RdgB/HAM1 family)
LTRANSLFPEGLLFASGNRNKYTEVVDLFAPLGIRILFGPDLLTLDVEETGNTYMSNARLKAREWALKAGIPALADDSGVEVRALGWKPGIFSARIAPDDPGRVHWMLDAMKNREDPEQPQAKGSEREQVKREEEPEEAALRLDPTSETRFSRSVEGGH